MPKKLSLSRVISKLIRVVPNVLNLACNMTSLLELEARLASRTVVYLLMLICMSVVLLTSTWMCMLAMIFIYLTMIHVNIFLILFILILLNIVLLLIIGMIVSKIQKNIFFPNVRRLVRKSLI